jgi:hypothetical protein
VDKTGISAVAAIVPKDLITKSKIIPCKVTLRKKSQTVTAERCMSASGLYIRPAWFFKKCGWHLTFRAPYTGQCVCIHGRLQRSVRPTKDAAM